MTLLIPGRTAADVCVVVRVEVDELERIVPLHRDGRHADDQRFGPQVGTDLRVRGVRIGRLNGPIVQGRTTRASLWIWFQGALNSLLSRSTKYEYMTR